MEDNIHINLELLKTDTHYLSIVKTRLWSYQLMSLKWMLYINIPSNTNLQNGLGLVIINTLALSVEGVIMDLISDHLFENGIEKKNKIKKLNLRGWRRKREMYNHLFKKNIELYESYYSIENLFYLRNNISHGETHYEINKRDIITDGISNIESVDENYQRVRSFLIDKKIIQETEIPSNSKVLWTMRIAHYFYNETICFLSSIIRENESPKKNGIKSEFENLLTNSY